MVTVIFYFYSFLFVLLNYILKFFDQKLINLININWFKNVFYKYDFYYNYTSTKSSENFLKFKSLYLLQNLYLKINDNSSLSILYFYSIYCIIKKQLVFTKNNNSSHIFKFFYIFINLILLRNKIKYLAQTRLIGSADSLSIFLYDFYKKPYNKLKYNEIKNYTKTVLQLEVNKYTAKSYAKVINFYNLFLNNISKSNLIILNNLSNTWNILFKPTSMDKYNSVNKVHTENNILFLRKNKVFNKGRYSRNRQTYRTGVYWCLYINIVAVLGLYFWFYRFTINFGYTWWFICIFVLAFFLPKILKFNLYNPKVFINEIKLTNKWIGHMFQYFFYILKLVNKEIKLNYKKFYIISSNRESIIKETLTEYFFMSIMNAFILLRLVSFNIIKLFMNINIYENNYKYSDYYFYNSNFKFFISDNYKKPFDVFFSNKNL